MHKTWFRKNADDTLAMQQLGHAALATNDLYVVVERDDFRRREAVVRPMQERFRCNESFRSNCGSFAGEETGTY